MNGTAAPSSPAPNGLLGTLRTWLRSRPGEAGQAVEEAAGHTLGTPAHFYGSVHVLVVDDNPVNLMVMSALLESRGLLPMLAADGAEAVALASELHFDLILMDLQMPVLDGLAATLAIRQHECTTSWPAVPVLAFSSALPSGRVLAAHGINGSLVKPCEDQDLEDCLVDWCPSYRAAPLAGVAAIARAAAEQRASAPSARPV